MANIARVVAYNSTTRRLYATDTNDTINISQIPLNITSDNALVNNNGLFVPKINTLTFNGTTNTISINMSDGSSKSVVISSITPDKFLQASSYNTTTKVLSLTMNDNVVIDVDLSDLVKIDVTDSPSIDLSGDGTSANPIAASLKLDPSPSNTATITSNGLLVTGGSASLTNSVQPSNATIENGTVPTTILGSLAFLLGAPTGWVEIAGGKKIPYWMDVNNNPVSPYMLFRASDYNGTPTLDYYGNPVTTSWNASSGDFTGTGNAIIQIAPTDISYVNSTNLTFEMWYQDVIPDIDIPNLFSIVNGEVFVPTYPNGMFTTVNTTNGINHFAVSYTNSGRYAVYLNGSLLAYSNIAAAGILSSVSIKSPNVIEASLVINAGIIYPASTGVNSITPTNMPLPPVVTVISTTTTPAPTTTTTTTTTPAPETIMLFDAQGVNGTVPTTDTLGNSITVTNGSIQNNKLVLTNGYLEYNTMHHVNISDSWTIDIVFEGTTVPAFELYKKNYQSSGVNIVSGGYIGTIPSSTYAPYITTGINYLRISYKVSAGVDRGMRIWMNGNSISSAQLAQLSGFDVIPFIGKFFLATGNINNVGSFNNKILGFRFIKNPTDIPTTTINQHVNVTVPSLPLTSI